MVQTPKVEKEQNIRPTDKIEPVNETQETENKEDAQKSEHKEDTLSSKPSVSSEKDYKVQPDVTVDEDNQPSKQEAAPAYIEGSNKKESPAYNGAPPAATPSQPDNEGNAKKNTKTQVNSIRKNKKAAATRCVNWCVASTIITVFLIVFIAVPTASVAIAGVYFDKCPVEPMIPIWLLVFGITCLLCLLVCIVCQLSARKRMKKQKKLQMGLDTTNERQRYQAELYEEEQQVSVFAVVVILILLLFLLVWFIVGNVYVFQNWGAVEDDTDQCNELLFYYSFSIIILVYVVGLVLCCICCILTCTALTAAEERYGVTNSNNES